MCQADSGNYRSESRRVNWCHGNPSSLAGNNTRPSTYSLGINCQQLEANVMMCNVELGLLVSALQRGAAVEQCVDVHYRWSHWQRLRLWRRVAANCAGPPLSLGTKHPAALAQPASAARRRVGLRTSAGGLLSTQQPRCLSQ